MNEKDLRQILKELARQPHESEWLEFKQNFHSPEEIGERISALANGACLSNKTHGFLIFGIEDGSHKITGTTFQAKSAKKGKEELENWLLQRLDPRIDFKTYEFFYSKNVRISMYAIPAATNRPVKFAHHAFIRIGSYTRSLKDFPEKEAKIWAKGNYVKFEKKIAATSLSPQNVVSLLDTQSYFDLIKLPYPSSRAGVIEKFLSESLIEKQNTKYSITNLGAILLAKNLEDFPDISRKSIRVIVYQGKTKIKTIREFSGKKGYVAGYHELIEWINSQVPANEEIEKSFRQDKRMYPEIAIRELLSNAIIHQDFEEKGPPMVEIFSDRIEICNPGLPLITPERFIDEYQSRNDNLADLMRRLGICEEKGSGIDKVIFYNELFQLPAIEIQLQEKHTKVIIYAYKTLNQMDKKDKIRACYQHCCLKYVSNDKMTNQTLRDRFQIEAKNAAIASRIIKETLNASLIKEEDPASNSRKYKKYIPFWA
ncbi:MAG: putative DNA binding domain-containing protein [Bacteroidia bacterium]|nr:putative DNA binding domain-containing protein [Bacteroidia bacterium]